MYYSNELTKEVRKGGKSTVEWFVSLHYSH